jgi:hypothetical protein
MNWLTLYLITALTLSLVVFYIDRTATLSMAIILLMWPIAILILVCLSIYERYKRFVCEKIHSILNGRTIDDCLSELTLKEMKYLAFGNKLKAFYLNDKNKKELLKRIEDSSFEDLFLNNRKK